jgi:hypothetical protein
MKRPIRSKGKVETMVLIVCENGSLYLGINKRLFFDNIIGGEVLWFRRIKNKSGLSLYTTIVYSTQGLYARNNCKSTWNRVNDFPLGENISTCYGEVECSCHAGFSPTYRIICGSGSVYELKVDNNDARAIHRLVLMKGLRVCRSSDMQRIHLINDEGVVISDEEKVIIPNPNISHMKTLRVSNNPYAVLLLDDQCKLSLFSMRNFEYNFFCEELIAIFDNVYRYYRDETSNLLIVLHDDGRVKVFHIDVKLKLKKLWQHENIKDIWLDEDDGILYLISYNNDLCWITMREMTKKYRFFRRHTKMRTLSTSVQHNAVLDFSFHSIIGDNVKCITKC